MHKDTMKSQLKLSVIGGVATVVSAGLAGLLGGCRDRLVEPKMKDYDSLLIATPQISKYGVSGVLRDFDRNGTFDAVVGRNNVVLFYDASKTDMIKNHAYFTDSSIALDAESFSALQDYMDSAKKAQFQLDFVKYKALKSREASK